MIIEVHDLTFEYPKQAKPAVDNISFEIAKGEIFGFLGPNGAGKSTTQKLITKILKSQKGQINVMGSPLEEWSNDFYEHIGVHFENPAAYGKLTPLENLEFFGSFYKRTIQDPLEILKKVDLEADAKKKVGEFSRGMKTRLNFARAILHNPEIIFCDEPTLGLDPYHQRQIKDLILEEKQRGKTIFLTTHNMNIADELCDRVAFIVNGKIGIIDKPRDLKVQYSKRTVEVSRKINSRSEKKEFSLDTIGTDSQFLEFIRQGQIETIHSRDATLEDIFLKLMGVGLT